MYLYGCVEMVLTVQWRIQDFPEVGAPTIQGAPTYDFSKFSQKIGPRGRARTKFCYADPPLLFLILLSDSLTRVQYLSTGHEVTLSSVCLSALIMSFNFFSDSLTAVQHLEYWSLGAIILTLFPGLISCLDRRARLCPVSCKRPTTIFLLCTGE